MPGDNQPPALQREMFNRPPRIWPSFPQGKVTIPAPPAREALPPKPPAVTIVLPLVMVALYVGISLLTFHGQMQQLVFVLPMVLFSIMTPAATILTTRQKIRQVKRQWKQGDKKYRALLKTLRLQLEEKADEQRRVALLKDPDNTELETYIQERTHLWERRPDDPDFLSVRVGRGAAPFLIEIQAPELEITHPMLPELEKFRAEFAMVKDIPCSVSLPKVKSMGITGPRQIVADFTRGFLCQIATLHSPEDVRIIGLFPARQKQDWEWLRDLPHTLPWKQTKGNKMERLFAAGQDEADLLLNVLLEELSQRAIRGTEADPAAIPVMNNGAQEMPLPHLVVIVHDYIEARKHPALSHAFKLGEQLGVSVIYLVAQEQAIPGECRGIIRILDSEHLSYAAAGYAGDTLTDVRSDIMELAMAVRIARAMSHLQVAVEGEDAVDIPTNVRLLDLLDIAYADQVNIEQWWSAPPFGRLRIPIGVGLNGTIWIDFNDNAHGPHGIIAGTTGAGKSELLSSLIVGLAMTHHPHLVNFVLVDFKGGAAFKPFEKIPHTVGMVSDLSGRLTERALHALKSELRRREHILSEANAKKIAQYQAMRMQNPSAFPPLPNLFIIIDEFAELAKEHPTFMDGVVSVVQKGRSLGVHLVLATQKPTGSVNPNIWSNLKFRICLRVASVQDSRDMLGRSEAALLPSGIPGRAYFQIGSEVFELFQSARISQKARVSNEAIILEKQAAVGAEEVTDQKVLMDLIEPYTETIGRELFRPWPDPLPARLSLEDLYRRHDMPSRLNDGNPATTPTYGWLNFPVGLVDLPVEQKQEPLFLDLPRQGGHILVAGASGSGKSTFLRACVLALAQTHTPAQLNMYLVDYGGQALRVFEKLPHVGGIFGESDEEHIRRLLRKLQSIIEERKTLFRTYQIDDFLAFQRRRLENNALPDLPAVVLVIDKFIEFKQAHDKDMDLLLSIARFGRNYGVFLILSADRPVSVPSQLMSLIDLRIGLRLVELTDSLILLGKNDAAHLDPALPGRGYRRGQTLDEVHFALPTSGEDDDEQTQLLARQVAQMAHEAEGALAPPIELLPDYVRIDDFLVEAAFSSPAAQRSRSIRLQIGIEDLSLQPIALELNSDIPHALVAGGPGSGRTGVLQTCLMVLANTPAYETTKVVMIDFRRTSRPLRKLPNMWLYASSEERLSEAIDALKKELRERMTHLREALEKQEDDDEPVGLDFRPLLLMIDDYDQLNALMKNPINDLKEFLLQSRDLGLHTLVAGMPGDLNRSDPLLTQVRAGRAGIILGGDPADQAVLGVRMADLPPGRGYLVRRHQRNLVQFAYLPPESIPARVKGLVQAAKEKKLPPAPKHSCPWCPKEKPEPDEPTPDEVRKLAGVS
ncbi:MAG TPA: type VII secretion protein EssC [Ktedonobacteraceae bacterium]|jgi:S-DNA-T family DNA segregation ATPase FtsK/SpoIIIE|nr:type VII secretion protein EssC [Ktedonobacteraceae bacterium]